MATYFVPAQNLSFHIPDENVPFMFTDNQNDVFVRKGGTLFRLPKEQYPNGDPNSLPKEVWTGEMNQALQDIGSQQNVFADGAPSTFQNLPPPDSSNYTKKPDPNNPNLGVTTKDSTGQVISAPAIAAPDPNASTPGANPNQNFQETGSTEQFTQPATTGTSPNIQSPNATPAVPIGQTPEQIAATVAATGQTPVPAGTPPINEPQTQGQNVVLDEKTGQTTSTPLATSAPSAPTPLQQQTTALQSQTPAPLPLGTSPPGTAGGNQAAIDASGQTPVPAGTPPINEPQTQGQNVQLDPNTGQTTSTPLANQTTALQNLTTPPAATTTTPPTTTSTSTTPPATTSTSTTPPAAFTPGTPPAEKQTSNPNPPGQTPLTTPPPPFTPGTFSGTSPALTAPPPAYQPGTYQAPPPSLTVGTPPPSQNFAGQIAALNAQQGAPAPVQAPPVTTGDDAVIDRWLDQLTKDMTPSEEQNALNQQAAALQAQLRNLNQGQGVMNANLEDQPIQLAFVTGQQSALERRYALQRADVMNQQMTINQQLALAQQKMQSAIDVDKTQLAFAQDKAKIARDAVALQYQQELQAYQMNEDVRQYGLNYAMDQLRMQQSEDTRAFDQWVTQKGFTMQEAEQNFQQWAAQEGLKMDQAKMALDQWKTMNQMQMDASAQEFSQWASQQNMGQQAAQQKFAEWATIQELTQDQALNAYTQWLDTQKLNQEQNVKAFDRWVKLQGMEKEAAERAFDQWYAEQELDQKAKEQTFNQWKTEQDIKIKTAEVKAKEAEAAKAQFMTLSPGATVFDPVTGKAIYTAPTAGSGGGSSSTTPTTTPPGTTPPVTQTPQLPGLGGAPITSPIPVDGRSAESRTAGRERTRGEPVAPLPGLGGAPSTTPPPATLPQPTPGPVPAPTTQPRGELSGNAPTTSLQPGSSGPEVEALQNYLVANGYMTQADMDTGPGIYGPKTTAAVLKLQQDKGVDNSSGPGFYGPKTIAAVTGQTNPQPTSTLGTPVMGPVPIPGNLEQFPTVSPTVNPRTRPIRI